MFHGMGSVVVVRLHTTRQCSCRLRLFSCNAVWQADVRMMPNDTQHSLYGNGITAALGSIRLTLQGS